MGNLLPGFYDIVMKPMEMIRFKKVRSELIKSAYGQVLEIGSGTGANFPLYKNVENVVAIEPSPKMNERAKKRAKQSHAKIKIYETSAESLPFDDNTFDTVIATLVFCTIPNPEKALKELKRVCKPGATLLFFEHVRFDNPILGKGQDMLNPFWGKISGGCQLNRNTLEIIKSSGVKVTEVKSMYNKLLLTIKGINLK